MGPAWAPPLLVGALIAVVTTPLLRRLALATGFVDRPGTHKSHEKPVPFLGGVALITAVLLGMVVVAPLGNQAIVIALGAGVLGTVGLIDDDRTVQPRIRLALQVVAAILTVALGLRVDVTGIAAMDAAITTVWIVGITNAFNLLDNMDGLSAGVAAAAAGSLLWLAAAGGAKTTAAAAAAVVGACLGFLAYNRSPASIFMGDTGSLFLGFAIAVLTIEVDPALAPPRSFVIPLLVLGVPILDTTTVTLSRLRRGRSVLTGGKDHLSHRLTVLGLSRAAAVAVLVGVEAVLGALAVLAGRRVVSLWVVAALAVAVLAWLSVVTSRAEVYQEQPLGWPRSLVLGAAAGAVGLLLLGALAVIDSPLADGTAFTRGRSSPAIALISTCGAVVLLSITLAAITRGRRGATEP